MDNKGLLQPQMEQIAPQGQQPQQGDGEQDSYDIFVAQGIKLAAKVAPQMRGNASVESLGQALFTIIEKLEREGIENNVPFSTKVLFHGSSEILTHLLDLSKVDIDEEGVKAVVGIAMGMYIDRGLKSGAMTPESLQQMAQQGQETLQGQGQQVQQGQPMGGQQNVMG